MFFFVFKQKTAYEMRISDWSSDVCSSDLGVHRPGAAQAAFRLGDLRRRRLDPGPDLRHGAADAAGDAAGAGGAFDLRRRDPGPDRGARKRVVSGKSVSVRVDLGGSRIIEKKNRINKYRAKT